jgi:hypothetical protein
MEKQYNTFIQRGWPSRIASIYSGWKAPIKQKQFIIKYVVFEVDQKENAI